MLSTQSGEDVLGMAGLVAAAGQNRRRALMVIFGRSAGQSSAGIYVYEAQLATQRLEVVQVGNAQMSLANAVV
jgi:hypothetical protein